MRVSRSVCGLLLAAASFLVTGVLGSVEGPLPLPAASPLHQKKDVFDGDMALETATRNQLALAESCSSSKYAHVCEQDAFMLFVGSMFGACSPVGCVRFEGPHDDIASAQKSDHEASATAIALRRMTDRLAAEQPGLSIEQHLLFGAITFEQNEARNLAAMTKLLKKRNGTRDMSALQLAVEDARNHGYAHRLVLKASDAIGWAASPADVVRKDQESLRRSNARCAESGTACGGGTAPLVVERGRRGKDCVLAACMDVARRAVGAADDDGAAWSTAMKRHFPSLLLKEDLRGFRRNLALVAKAREQEEIDTDNMVQTILVEGHERNGDFDLGALRFFAEFSKQQGFDGSALAEARLILARHATFTMIRSASNRLVTAAGNTLLAFQNKAKDAKMQLAVAAGKQQQCTAEVDSLRSKLKAHVHSLDEAESEVAALGTKLQDRHLALEESARQLQEGLEREKNLRAVQSVLEQERDEMAKALADSRAREQSLVGDVDACGADLGAARMALEQERGEMAKALSDSRAREQPLVGDAHACGADLRARSSETGKLAAKIQGQVDAMASEQQRARGFAKTIAEHESLANSLRLELGRASAKTLRIQTEATSLKEAVRDAEHQTRITQQGLDRCSVTLTETTSLAKRLTAERNDVAARLGRCERPRSTSMDDDDDDGGGDNGDSGRQGRAGSFVDV